LVQRYAEVRIDNRQKAGWRVVKAIEGIGYSVIHYERSGINDFDLIFNATGVGKIDSHDPEVYLKEIADMVEKNGMINPTYVLPKVNTGGEKILRDVAVEVIEHRFGAHNVRIECL